MASETPTDASMEAALEALRTQQESSMLFASYAANATGLLAGAHTNWELGEGSSMAAACDFCKVANCRCVRSNLEDVCNFCRTRSLNCVGPGNIRRANMYQSVALNIDPDTPTWGEVEIGQAVALRDASGRWNPQPRQIKKIVYKPVAVVLDDENSPPVSIDSVRPWPSRAEIAQLAAAAAARTAAQTQEAAATTSAQSTEATMAANN